MARYEKYKDSSIEWIGDIPDHWEVKKLKYKINFVTGYTPPSGKSEYYTNGQNIWVTITDMKSKFIEDSVQKITNNAIADLGLIILPIGSLLYSFKLSVGKVAFNDREIYTNEAIFSILPNKKINLNFYYYSLPQQVIKNANENIYGAKILNQNLIKNANLIIPPFNEQTTIANYLDNKTAKIEQIIKQKEKLLVLYEEEKTAIINQAVTKGINPDVNFKDSGIDWIGNIPEHWEVKKLKYAVNINTRTISEKTDKNYSLKYIDIGNVEYGVLKEKPKKIVFCNAPSRARRIVKSGDTLVSTVRTYLKAILFIENADNNLIASTGFAVISPSMYFDHKYLFFILSSEIIIQSITAHSVGVNYPAINANEIGIFFIWLPPKKEQTTIVTHIETQTAKIDSKTTKTKQLITLLKEYKTALISEVVTGKLRVS